MQPSYSACVPLSPRFSKTMILSFLFRTQVCHLAQHRGECLFSFPREDKSHQKVTSQIPATKLQEPSMSTRLSFLQSSSCPWALEGHTFQLPWKIPSSSNLLSQTSSTLNHALLSLFLNPHLPPVTPLLLPHFCFQ